MHQQCHKQFSTQLNSDIIKINNKKNTDIWLIDYYEVINQIVTRWDGYKMHAECIILWSIFLLWWIIC